MTATSVTFHGRFGCCATGGSCWLGWYPTCPGVYAPEAQRRRWVARVAPAWAVTAGLRGRGVTRDQIVANAAARHNRNCPAARRVGSIR